MICRLIGHRFEVIRGTTPLAMLCLRCGKVKRVIA